MRWRGTATDIGLCFANDLPAMITPAQTNRIRIGCAGWNIPRASSGDFPEAGTHLQRYAETFSAVEINSSFYRPHRPATYARWADSVPADFRFSVKVPKQITHQQKLADTAGAVDEFLQQVQALGDRLGCLLVQLPPSLKLDAAVARAFFAHLRHAFACPIVCEPRHASWFTAIGEDLLQRFDIGRVAADPAPCPGADLPAGSLRTCYYRLHGSPQMYYSSYDAAYLAAMAKQLVAQSALGRQAWCIFDNTAAGAATVNALQLQRLLATSNTPPHSITTGTAAGS